MKNIILGKARETTFVQNSTWCMAAMLNSINYHISATVQDTATILPMVQQPFAENTM